MHYVVLPFRRFIQSRADRNLTEIQRYKIDFRRAKVEARGPEHRCEHLDLHVSNACPCPVVAALVAAAAARVP